MMLRVHFVILPISLQPNKSSSPSQTFHLITIITMSRMIAMITTITMSRMITMITMILRTTGGG